MGAFILLVFSNETAGLKWLGGAIFDLFAAMGSYTLSAYINTRINYDKTGFRYRKSWGKVHAFLHEDIKRIKVKISAGAFETDMTAYILYTDKINIRIDPLLTGESEFIKAVHIAFHRQPQPLQQAMRLIANDYGFKAA